MIIRFQLPAHEDHVDLVVDDLDVRILKLLLMLLLDHLRNPM